MFRELLLAFGWLMGYGKALEVGHEFSAIFPYRIHDISQAYRDRYTKYRNEKSEKHNVQNIPLPPYPSRTSLLPGASDANNVSYRIYM